MPWLIQDTARAIAAGLYKPGDDTTKPPPNRNSTADNSTETAIDTLATRQQRIAATQVTAAKSDTNFQPPAAQYDTQGQRIYETAPIPLKRLLGSPLQQTGPYAKGPNSERLVEAGWTEVKGLDFTAPYGEPLFSCADGTVTFVGYQVQKSETAGIGIHQDSQWLGGRLGNILGDNGAIIIDQTKVGAAGIFIRIEHDGDFQGYATEYQHLSGVTVVQGEKVTEGHQIGFIGNSGMVGLGPHLHLQVVHVAGATRTIVNPTAMVPNKRNGNLPDSTNTAANNGILMPPLAPAGAQAAARQAANQIGALDRTTSITNRSTLELKQGMAQHAEYIAQVVGVQQTALYAASTAFTGKSPVINNRMSFDFKRGVWLVGDIEDGVV